MGILDDAIREHLDLKRRQGAAEEELARLEDEAFGPPSRPGDPEFAERPAEGEGAGTPAGNGAVEQEAEATATEVPTFHDQETGGPSEGEELADAGAPDAEVGSGEHAAIAGEPAVEEPPAPSESAAPAGEPTVEHDTLGAEEEAKEIDLDLDLDLDQEIDDVGELELTDDEAGQQGEPSGEKAESAGGGGEPIESLDTVEHHFEDALDEAEVVEEDDLSLADDSDDEDVLEETPEFLRDAPEDDELWFEQGEPKDFDF